MENGAFAPKEQMLHFPQYFQISDISKASKGVNIICYMTPIKDLLWLDETSLHWLWQILMSKDR